MKMSLTQFIIQSLKHVPVTLSFFVICILVMFLEVHLSGSKELTIEAVQSLGALQSNDYSIHLFTYMFLHGSLTHICVNMFALLSLGILLETRWGSFKFSIIYLFAGLIGGLFATSFSNSYTLTVGASGALVGLIGADFMNHIYYKAYQTRQGKKSMFMSSIDMIILVLISFIPNVSWLGHLGGFIGGIVVSFLISLLFKNENMTKWRQSLEPKEREEIKNLPPIKVEDRIEPKLENVLEKSVLKSE